MNDERLQRHLLSLTYLVALVGGAILFYYAHLMILTCLIGVGLGVLISPLLDYAQLRWRLPRGLSAFIVLLFLFLLTLTLFYGIYIVAADQFVSLQQSAPDILARLRELAAHASRRVPWLQNQLESFDFGSLASSMANPLWVGVRSGFAALTGAAFACILALYTAVGADEYHEMILRPFPPRLRPKADHFFRRSALVLRQWFRAQLIDMVIIGSLTAAGLWMVGVTYWAVFGLLTAVLCIIPYVGTIIVIVLAGLVTLASEPSQFPWVMLVFLITQQIEGNLILPMVMRGQADLPEVPLLIFMLVLGTWLGLLGVFLAPPLFAVLKVAYTELYLPKIEGRA